MGFPEALSLSELPFPSSRTFLDPDIKPEHSVSPPLQVDPLLLSHWGTPSRCLGEIKNGTHELMALGLHVFVISKPNLFWGARVWKWIKYFNLHILCINIFFFMRVDVIPTKILKKDGCLIMKSRQCREFVHDYMGDVSSFSVLSSLTLPVQESRPWPRFIQTCLWGHLDHRFCNMIDG